MTTVLEVVDSAVKIGLGALITAVAGYLALVRSQHHELRKTADEDRRNLLRSAASLLEQATALANLATFTFAHVPDGSHDSTKQLVEAINKLGEARSLAVLSGAKQLAEEIANLRSAMESFCGYFLTMGENYSIPDANAKISQLNESWPRIYHELERAYTSLR
ncbi:hypothetical protein [Chitinivorax sp. B]|uniref:hypothetical protein n=1 Tax=Chitinivorax sp. B TaxID=2502235 RepID=UPI0010FA5E33|nr:hypothetical protein [Chitinivorax sp. B]